MNLIDSVSEVAGSEIQSISNQIERLINSPDFYQNPAAMAEVQKFLMYFSLYSNMTSAVIKVHGDVAKTIVHNMAG